MKIHAVFGIVLATIAPVCAADLVPHSAGSEAPLSSPHSWSGLYVGINAGAAWSSAETSTNSVPTFGAPLGGGVAVAASMAAVIPHQLDTHRAGFIGGAHIGYNWQRSWLVLGLEADLDGASARATTSKATIVPIVGYPFNSTAARTAISNKLDYVGMVRARVGVTPLESVLVYATGGFAYSEVRGALTVTERILGPSTGIDTTMSARASTSEVKIGWVIGLGAEYALTPTWSFKGEYLHYDLGTTRGGADIASNYTGGGGVFASSRTAFKTRWSGDIGRAGLSYHF